MSAPTPKEQWYDEWLSLFANRDEVARQYARLISPKPVVALSEVDAAILRRWSPSALDYIKLRARRLEASRRRV